MKKLLSIILTISLFTSSLWSATLVNDGNINWNGNWQTVGQDDAIHASTNLVVDSGLIQYSNYWTGSAGKTDIGCLAYLATLTTPATARTITVTLQSDNATDFVGATDEQTSTFTTSSATKLLTWMYFKLSATETEDGVTPLYYRYKFATDNAADTGLRADAAAATTVAVKQMYSTTATIATTDTPQIIGIAGAQTGNPLISTVTYNVQADDDFGGADGLGIGNIDVWNSGRLEYATTANTSYYMEVVGNVNVRNGGVFNIGKTDDPIPFSSTATFEMNGTAVVRLLSIQIGGSMQFQGAPFTGNLWRTTTADAIGATTDRSVELTDNIVTAGWLPNHDIIISNTSSTAGQTEEKIIKSLDVSPSSCTITTDWTSTHLAGAEVCNMTRSVNITASGANGFSIVSYSTTFNEVNIDWVRFRDYVAGTGTGIIRASGDGSYYSLDYSVIDTMTPYGSDALVAFGNYMATQPAGGQTMTDMLFYFGGLNLTSQGLQFQSSGLGGSGSVKTLPKYTLSNSSFVKMGNTTGNMLYIYNTDVTLNNCNFYDYTSGTNKFYGIALGTVKLKLINCKLWGLEGGLSHMSFGGSGSTYSPSIAIIQIYNSIFGGDGTNTVANVYHDIFVGNSNGYVNAYNTKFLSTTEITMPTLSYGTPQEKYVSSYNHDATQYRNKIWQVWGTITDNTTTSVTGQGGSGSCLVMNPNSSTAGNTLNWVFNLPVIAATNPDLKFYINASAGTPSLNIDIYDSDDDYTLLTDNTSLSFNATPTTWEQQTISAISPTNTGYCRVVLKALDDGSARNIGIDTLSYVYDGTTYTYDFTSWSGGGAPPAAPTPFVPQIWMLE